MSRIKSVCKTFSANLFNNFSKKVTTKAKRVQNRKYRKNKAVATRAIFCSRR